jgi:hypothetical protein
MTVRGKNAEKALKKEQRAALFDKSEKPTAMQKTGSQSYHIFPNFVRIN